MISLPDGSLFITDPATFATLTNLSDTTKSVTLSITGTAVISPVQNGTQTVSFHGRNLVDFPRFGLLRLLIGDSTVVVDVNTGHLLAPPTGNGQSIDLCELID